MKPTLGIALALAAAASAARAERMLDAAGGAVYVTSIDGARAFESVRTPDGREARYEVVATGANAQADPSGQPYERRRWPSIPAPADRRR